METASFFFKSNSDSFFSFFSRGSSCGVVAVLSRYLSERGPSLVVIFEFFSSIIPAFSVLLFVDFVVLGLLVGAPEVEALLF